MKVVSGEIFLEGLAMQTAVMDLAQEYGELEEKVVSHIGADLSNRSTSQLVIFGL
jgi:hypothetical protein